MIFLYVSWGKSWSKLRVLGEFGPIGTSGWLGIGAVCDRTLVASVCCFQRCLFSRCMTVLMTSALCLKAAPQYTNKGTKEICLYSTSLSVQYKNSVAMEIASFTVRTVCLKMHLPIAFSPFRHSKNMLPSCRIQLKTKS